MFWCIAFIVFFGLCYYVDHLPEEEQDELDTIIRELKARKGPVAVIIQPATLLLTGNITVLVKRLHETPQTWVIKTSSRQRFLHKAALAFKGIKLNVDSGSHGVSATTLDGIHAFPNHCFA